MGDVGGRRCRRRGAVDIRQVDRVHAFGLRIWPERRDETLVPRVPGHVVARNQRQNLRWCGRFTATAIARRVVADGMVAEGQANRVENRHENLAGTRVVVDREQVGQIAVLNEGILGKRARVLAQLAAHGRSHAVRTDPGKIAIDVSNAENRVGRKATDIVERRGCGDGGDQAQADSSCCYVFHGLPSSDSLNSRLIKNYLITTTCAATVISIFMSDLWRNDGNGLPAGTYLRVRHGLFPQQPPISRRRQSLHPVRPESPRHPPGSESGAGRR